jgi:hypothetical protein
MGLLRDVLHAIQMISDKKLEVNVYVWQDIILILLVAQYVYPVQVKCKIAPHVKKL